MKTAEQIKQAVVDAMASCGVFDTVLTPSDDRQETAIMPEPSAAVYYTGCSLGSDNGVKIVSHNISVRMKFRKVGVNETTDDIQTAVDALIALEPASIKQSMLTASNKHSGLYGIEMSFAGCRR